MKKPLLKILFSFLLAVCLFVQPVLAAQTVSLPDDGMTLQLPDDFTIVRRDNLQELSPFLESFGTTVSDTDIKLSQENYRFLAVSSTMGCTLFLTAREDEVSRSIGDLISYPDTQTAKGLLLGKTLPEGVTVKEWERDGALFFRVDFGTADQVGRIAYFTVMNDTAYTLGVVDNNGTLTDNTNALIDTVFNNWEYTIQAEQQRIQSFRQKITSVFYWICQIAAVAALVFIIRLAIKDVRQKQMEEDKQKNLPKKPRR